MAASRSGAAVDGLRRLFDKGRHERKLSQRSLGLDAMRAACAALDHPEQAIPCVHVAGTNGKGSTCGFLDSILRAAGLRVGMYTSPHLHQVNERIRLDGCDISDAQLIEVLEKIDERAGHLVEPMSFFEQLTLAAFETFRAQECDIGILEVGLGGRLDATNVVDGCVHVITSIGFDHQALLGNTLGAIAVEKAGIIKTSAPTVIGEVDDEALAALESSAQRAGSQSHIWGRDYWLEDSQEGQALFVMQPDHCLRLKPGLLGRHQQRNAACASAVALLLRSQGWQAISQHAIERGIAQPRWPGRLECLALPEHRELLLDAAHNLQGCQTLADYLRSEDAKPRALIFAALADKPAAEMLALLRPSFDHVVLTKPKQNTDPQVGASSSKQDAWEPSWLSRHGDWTASCPAEALEIATGLAPQIVGAGSVALVASLRALAQRHRSDKLPFDFLQA